MGVKGDFTGSSGFAMEVAVLDELVELNGRPRARMTYGGPRRGLVADRLSSLHFWTVGLWAVVAELSACHHMIMGPSGQQCTNFARVARRRAFVTQAATGSQWTSFRALQCLPVATTTLTVASGGCSGWWCWRLVVLRLLFFSGFPIVFRELFVRPVHADGCNFSTVTVASAVALN